MGLYSKYLQNQIWPNQNKNLKKKKFQLRTSQDVQFTSFTAFSVILNFQPICFLFLGILKGTDSISAKNLCCSVSKTLRYHRIQYASKTIVSFVNQPRLPQILLGLHWPRQNNASEELRISNIDGAQFFFSALDNADDWSWLENQYLILAGDFEIPRGKTGKQVSSNNF